MKRRMLILLMLMGLLLIVGGSGPALAGSPRGIVGLIGFHAPWAGGMDIFIDFDVHDINPHTYRARGPVSWKIWHQEWGWREVDAYAACVHINEEDGEAILVSRIFRKAGWGQGEPGEYAYWWVRDSEGGDQFGINYYRLDDPGTPEDEWYEFFPRGRPPDCEFFEMTEPPLDVDLGDLAIQQ